MAPKVGPHSRQVLKSAEICATGDVLCVCSQEQPQLENDRSHLLQLIANDQMVLRELEDKSLSLLQKSQGTVTGDLSYLLTD